jgi:hypothetical protein
MPQVRGDGDPPDRDPPFRLERDKSKIAAEDTRVSPQQMPRALIEPVEIGIG